MGPFPRPRKPRSAPRIPQEPMGSSLTNSPPRPRYPARAVHRRMGYITRDHKTKAVEFGGSKAYQIMCLNAEPASYAYESSWPEHGLAAALMAWRVVDAQPRF